MARMLITGRRKSDLKIELNFPPGKPKVRRNDLSLGRFLFYDSEEDALTSIGGGGYHNALRDTLQAGVHISSLVRLEASPCGKRPALLENALAEQVFYVCPQHMEENKAHNQNPPLSSKKYNATMSV